MSELTDKEMERLDHIRDIVYDFINSLIPNGKTISEDDPDLPDLTDRILETVWEGIKEKGLGFTEIEFYPYRESGLDEAETDTDEMVHPIWKGKDVIREINHVPTLIAYGDDDGLIAVEYNGPNRNKEAVADMIEATEGFPFRKVSWVKSDESNNTAYFRVK